MADMLNVKPNTIWRWECGEREPRAKKVRELANIFGVTVSYLLRETDSNDDALAIPQKQVPNIQHPKDLAPARKVRGKLYVDGKSLDRLALELRDRLETEFNETDTDTLAAVKEALAQCRRIYEDREKEVKAS